MRVDTYVVRNGYDGKRCLVHARCCRKPDGQVLATAQYLDVDGCDLFSGLLLSRSEDDGRIWSEFVPQKGLAPIHDESGIHVGCDATPMFHKKTGKVLLLGHTAHYNEGAMHPSNQVRKTFYSVYDEEKKEFGGMKFLEMPEEYAQNCGNGSGQSVELENGDLLIPVYFKNKENGTSDEGCYSSMALKCSFDGENLELLECGNPLTMAIGRGLYEPSLICHKGVYYMTLRNDECGCVARSEDGVHYTELQLWKWEDGSLLDNYNTQQHWMLVGGDLYLVYTRRHGNNDHVFRHRAPLFAARVENMCLIRESEQIIVTERGARLGNFTAESYADGSATVMAAEWMQPKGCEAYGSDNTIFYCRVKA